MSACSNQKLPGYCLRGIEASQAAPLESKDALIASAEETIDLLKAASNWPH